MAREDEVAKAMNDGHSAAASEPTPGPNTTSDPSPTVITAAQDEHPWSGEPSGYSGKEAALTGQTQAAQHPSPPVDTTRDDW